MKTKTSLICVTALIAAIPLSAQVLKDYWDFDTDAASDSLNAIHNSGILKSAWDGPAAGGDAADGAGNWNVVGDGGTLQREAPAYGEYAFAPTTGRHRLEIDFAAWAFDAASEGDSLVLRLDESVAAGGGNVARIELRVFGGVAQIRQSTDLLVEGEPNSAFRTTDLTLTEAAGASVAIEFDFDKDTATYFLNGEVTHVFDDFAGVDVANIRYQKNTEWSTAASSVTVDSMGWVTLDADDTAIEYFTFDSDLGGSQLQEIENSGSLGNTWSFNGAGGDAADGVGAWLVPGDSATTNRKLPAVEYVTPVTTGRYRLEADFASWDFDAASVGDKWTLSLNESGPGSPKIAQFILEVDSASSVRLRLAGDFVSGSSFRNYPFSLAEISGVSAAIEFDFDNDTAYYIVDGVIQEVFTDFDGTDISQMSYIKSGDGTADWTTAASSLTVNSFGYRSVAAPVSDANAQELWSFDYESVGNDLGDIANTGVLNSVWNISGASTDGANGAGQWTVTGDSGTFTRKLPDAGTANADLLADEYAAPVETGKYRFVVDFASWNVDAASVGDVFSIKLNESADGGGSTLANIQLELNATDVTVKWGSTTQTGGAFRTEILPLVNPDGARVEIEFDFDNDVVSYYLDGAFKYSFSGVDAFNGDDIGQLLYVKANSGTWGTAATSILIDEVGYFAVPANTVIDEWHFEEADGTAPSAAKSNKGTALGGNPPAAVIQVSGGALVFGSDGVESGVFTASDLSEDPITSGIIEVSFTVTAACFNNTYANSVLPARAGFRLQDRQDGNKNVGVLKFVYDPVENQFQANSETFGSGSKTVAIQSGSPVLLEDVTLRMLIDLDEPTVPGSFQAFFTYGDGEEQVVVFDGVVGEAFGGNTQIDVFGINQQITNGSTGWEVGDTVAIDDLVIQRSGPVYRPVFLGIAHDGTNGVLSFDTVNTLEYSIRASSAVGGEYLEIDTVTGDGTRKDFTDDARGTFNAQFYRIQSVD